MDTGNVDRRKARLSSQLSVLSKKRNNDGLDSLVGLTVDAVLGNSQELNKPTKPTNQQQSTRTLLDIISDEESGAAYRGLVAHNSIKNKKKSKKSIKDRLKFRRPGSSTSRPVPTSDFPINNRRIQQISDPILVDRPSLRSLSLSCSIKRIIDESDGKSDLTTETPSDVAGKSDLPALKRETVMDEERKSDSSDEDADGGVTEAVIRRPAEDTELKSATPSESELDEEVEVEEVRNPSRPLISEPTSDDEDEEENENENESGPLISESMVEMPTISLMALLEESGRRADEEEEEEEEEEEDEEEEGGEEYECTVCMVKHRGLAFVPCGHTFCRLCTKELWVSRGNCPLCTAYILEILDIF